MPTGKHTTTQTHNVYTLHFGLCTREKARETKREPLYTRPLLAVVCKTPPAYRPPVPAHSLRRAGGGRSTSLLSGKRVENRQQEVSEFSRSLKLLAKELEVPVIAISQLNRGPEQRQDKRPMLSDLRESGSLEQDADMVVLLHREDAYDRESPRAGEADFIVAKHRNGPTATVTVAFQGHYSRFVDMARDSI